MAISMKEQSTEKLQELSKLLMKNYTLDDRIGKCYQSLYKQWDIKQRTGYLGQLELKLKILGSQYSLWYMWPLASSGNGKSKA